VIPTDLVDSILRTGFKDLSVTRHRVPEGDATVPAEVVGVAQQAQFLDLTATNLNNDFEHHCFDVAVRRLGASQLVSMEGDIGPHVFRIPGIPKGRFLPHQVWGIWFLVERVIGYSPPVCLLADDMGLGKTFTALGALLHLKWISSEAALGNKLACLEDRTVEDLGDDVPPFFGLAKEVFRRPSVVMVPASLVRQWDTAIKALSEEAGATLTNLNLTVNRWLSSEILNYRPDLPERGRAIHLISYETYRARCPKGGVLERCAWGIGIFDESHSVRSRKTQIYSALFHADVGGKFQLTGTPMYLDVNSWVVQAEWLFSRIKREARGRHGPERLREILAAVKTGEVAMNDAYQGLKTAAHPWMIRRWAETKGADGEPLVAKEHHAVEDVRLAYTEAELGQLNDYITKLKDRKNLNGHISTVIHEWRLACLSMSLPENDAFETDDGALQYRQSWDRETYHQGPAIRWLRKKPVPILLGEPANGAPNKAVIFTPLPGQAWFVHWYLNTFHPGLKSFIYHSGMPIKDRNTLIEEFSGIESPATLTLTPTLGGTGLNLVAANHIVIMQKFWVLNEQRQAIGRIDRLGQKRKPTAWILHCQNSVDDRAEELHKLRAVYEARIMHGLMGESFSYSDLVSACQARLQQQQQQEAEFAEIANLETLSNTPQPLPVRPRSREETPASDG